MKIEAEWQSGMHFTCATETNHTIDIDSGPRGAETRGPAPMEMLLNAVATCSGMDIVSILQKKRKEPESFSVTVEGERAETHPKIFTKIHIRYAFKKDGLTEKDVEQAIRLSMDKYCSVVAAFGPGTEVTWNYTIEK